MTTRTRPPVAPSVSRGARIARLLPVPAGAGMARILVERNVMAFRHGWVAIITGFAEPVFYLFSLGIGLGALVRGTLYSSAFLLVAWLAGTVHSWWALLAVPAATFIGFAFSAVGMFATTFMRSWVDFDYVTLAIQPMFLFSATFFPLSTYPGPVQWLVQLTPLYHGVALERGLMLGEVGAALLLHVLYLAVLGLVGFIGTARRIERLLLS